MIHCFLNSHKTLLSADWWPIVCCPTKGIVLSARLPQALNTSATTKSIEKKLPSSCCQRDLNLTKAGEEVYSFVHACIEIHVHGLREVSRPLLTPPPPVSLPTSGVWVKCFLTPHSSSRTKYVRFKTYYIYNLLQVQVHVFRKFCYIFLVFVP